MTEIDFISEGGLRIRTMEVLPAGAAMILDAKNELCALYHRNDRWRVSNPNAAEWSQLVLSQEMAAQIARELARSPPPDPHRP